ncbi:unnamed protein product, partial [Chrysoparadoxa australica]
LKKPNPWVLAARPKTLPAGAGPVLLGLAAAYSFIGKVDIFIGLITLICALLLQVSSNLINDYYDGVGGLDDENRLGPPRAVALGLLEPKQVKRGFQITLLLSFVLGVILMIKGGLPIIMIGLSSLFFSWAYTGGPFPLSHLGLGEIFAYLFFGPIAVLGTFILQLNNIESFFYSHYFYQILALGSGVGVISSALMGVNNLRDRFTDEDKGKITLATLLGGHKMRKLIILFLISSQFLGMLSLYLGSFKPFSLLYITGIVPFILFSKVWWQLLGSTDGKELNNTLATVGKYLFLYSLFFGGLLIATTRTSL